MNINVITPYFVLNNSLFEKTENGYSYSSVGKNADTVFLYCAKKTIIRVGDIISDRYWLF